jgi:hypothetical protein
MQLELLCLLRFLFLCLRLAFACGRTCLLSWTVQVDCHLLILLDVDSLLELKLALFATFLSKFRINFWSELFEIGGVCKRLDVV